MGEGQIGDTKKEYPGEKDRRWWAKNDKYIKMSVALGIILILLIVDVLFLLRKNSKANDDLDKANDELKSCGGEKRQLEKDLKGAMARLSECEQREEIGKAVERALQKERQAGAENKNVQIDQIEKMLDSASEKKFLKDERGWDEIIKEFLRKMGRKENK